VNETAPRGLVPPRPNLGPEPWADDQSGAAILTATGILALSVLAWLAWRLIVRGGARSRRGSLVPLHQPDATPRGQFVALSDSIREALIAQFGTTWRAKTTEELSADAGLEHTLGREASQELIRFLDQADHLKFAPERPSHGDESIRRDLATWQPRVADLLTKIRARPNGRSRSIRAEPTVNNSPNEHAAPAARESHRSEI
jgi:hypothetical protein